MQNVEQWPLDRFREYERNPRRNDHAVDQAAAAIGHFGFRVPILAKSDGLVIDGHLRLKAARKLGLATVPVLLADDMSDVEVRAFRVSVNKIADLAEWDFSLLRDELADLDTGEFDMSVIGFSDAEMEQIQTWTPGGTENAPGATANLSDRFMLPPFSVLNAREGWWQDRKRAWIALGIQSELGRGETPGTSARVGPDEPSTYRTIGGRANATPGGHALPAADYSNKERGDGKGRPIGRRPNAIPGGQRCH